MWPPICPGATLPVSRRRRAHFGRHDGLTDPQSRRNDAELRGIRSSSFELSLSSVFFE